MTLRWIRTLRRLGQSLSVRAGLYCVGAIAAALVAVMASPYVPDEAAELLGGNAVDQILRILASSMLAVVTFSLSTLVASYAAAAASAPARATGLIMKDKRAQNALSTFLGAFIFSVVALVALSTKYYGPKGRVILFAIMLFVLGAVIWTVIRWIGQLSEIGQLANILKTIEKATSDSIKSQCHYFSQLDKAPCPAWEAAVLLTCEETGFIQTIDLKRLSEIVDERRIEIWLKVHAGHFVYPGTELARFALSGSTKDDKELIQSIRSCFLIGHRRTFEDDPRFGFIVMSEVASRALSPGVNDPGTAIEVVGCLLRMISKIHETQKKVNKRRWSDSLHLWPMTPEEILDDGFQAISRDGAGYVEVGIFLQKTFGSIRLYPQFEKAAIARARRSLDQNAQVIKSRYDMERLSRASQWLEQDSRDVTHPCSL